MEELSSAHRRLSDDHDAVGELLKQLLTALDNKDAAASYSRLDLLWARLAVHIRAEHLHLFPAVITYSSEAPTTVENLRADHDFFMRELARAIGILRARSDEPEFAAVRNAVLEIERRLIHHNEIEESQVYPWARAILTESEQLDLTARINAELENRPPRFSEESWANLV